MGVFRSVELPVYEDELHRQIARASTQATGATLATLLRRDTETWRIEPRAAGDGAARGALVGSGSGLDDSLEEKASYVADLDRDTEEVHGVERVIGSPLSEIVPQTAAVTLPIDAPIREALTRMRSGRALATILVATPDGAIVGVVTERDMFHRLPADVDLDTAPVRMAMTPDPEWLQPTNLVAHALHFMSMRGYRRVLVGGPTGARAVLTVDDVVDFVRRQALRQPPVAEVPRRNAGVDVPCLALRYRTTGSQSQQIFPSSKTGSSGVPSCARAPRRMFSMA